MDDSEALAAKAIRRREWGILLTLGAVQFTSIVDFMVIMPLEPQLSETMRLNSAQFGFIVASYGISAGIAGFLASTSVDRFGRKAAFLSIYLGFLLGTLFCGLAPNYTTLLWARVVTGAFGGIMGGLALTIIGDVFPDERRGRATGFLFSAFSLASVFGVPIGLSLGERYGWHTPFLILVALGLPILLLGIWFLPPLRDHLSKTPVNQWEKMKETYSHPNHIRAFLLVVSMMMGTFMVVPFIAGYLVSNGGVSKADMAWVYFGGGLCSLISSPLIGKWSDRVGKLKVYRIVAPFSALMMIILTNLPEVGLLLATAAVSMMMVSNAGRMVAAMAMINGSVENRLRGGFMSAYSSIQHISSGIGVSLAGLIIVKPPGGQMKYYGWVGVVGVVLTLLSLWLAGRLRPAAKPAPPVIEPMQDEMLQNVTAAEAF